jgi:hypothetical protein
MFQGLDLLPNTTDSNLKQGNSVLLDDDRLM